LKKKIGCLPIIFYDLQDTQGDMWDMWMTDWMNETKEDQNQYFPYVCKSSVSNKNQISIVSLAFIPVVCLFLSLSRSFFLSIKKKKSRYKCFMDDMWFYFCQLYVDCKKWIMLNDDNTWQPQRQQRFYYYAYLNLCRYTLFIC
jgi:hypothetical protein